MEWLDYLPYEVRVKFAALIEKFAEHGPTLDFPYTSQIAGKLRELRMRMGKTRYRVLYFFDQHQAGVLLHGFTKNSVAIPQADAELGLRRMRIHVERLLKRGEK